VCCFLIPKAKPPVLDGPFSSVFKEFVSLCLTKEPAARPTTKELLQHRFIRNARKTAYLTELIERYNEFRAHTPGRGPAVYQQTVRNWDTARSMQSEWMFETIKTNSAMGTFKGVAKDVMQTGVVPDPDEEDELVIEDPAGYDVRSSYVSGAATRGSDPLVIGFNVDAVHSTMVIKAPPDEQDIPALLGDSASSENYGSIEGPSTPPQREPPPAYSGSTRSSRRASYAARNNTSGLGTVMREADLGTGVDTIRPVKKVDTVGSLRLSSEYVGNMREGSTCSAPSSPVKEKSSLKRAKNEALKAGLSLVDDVVLPTCERTIRDDMDAREIESLSMISRGFAELKEVNPELAYNLIVDIISGVNENSAVREYIQTSRGLFPHKRIIRKSEMTTKGLIVTEEQEIDGLPSTSTPIEIPTPEPPGSPTRKSPIAELLYMRWLEGLKLKWPSIL